MSSRSKITRGSNPRGSSASRFIDSRSRCWCFTINNPLPDYEDLQGLPGDLWKYMIVGKEIGDKGTPHLQGFVIMFNRVRFSYMKKRLPRAHIEPMKGDSFQASEYCKKDGQWEELGEFELITPEGGASGGKAKADRYRNMIQIVKDHHDLDTVLELDPVSFLQHYHAYKRIIQDNPKKIENLKEVCGEWIYGPPGVGKSHKVREENPIIYLKPANKWWDGYKNEDVVYIEDFDMNHKVLGHHLKLWADKWPFAAEQKGTTVQIRPKKLIITSNYSIEEIFNEDPVLQEAIKRRFRQIHMQNPFNQKYAEHSAQSEEEPMFVADSPQYEYGSDLENCP